MSKPSLNDILATNLARLMEKAGHKQASLAKLSGIGQTTISLYLNPGRRQPSKSGKVPSAKFGEVETLAEVLGVEPWDLLRPYDAASGAALPNPPPPPRSYKPGGLVDMDHADDPFPMRIAGLPPAPWEGGMTTKQMEREAHGLRISHAINVGHVEDSGYSANDHEFVPIPELDVRMAAGKLGIENYQETEIGQILLRRSFLESFKRPIKRMKICYGIGFSMEPVIRHRNPMLVDIHPVELDEVQPRFVYAINRGGEMIVKCLERWKDGTWMAISTNLDPEYHPFPLATDDGREVRIIGTVLWSPYDLRNGIDERLLQGWRPGVG